MPFARSPGPRALRAVRDANRRPYWLDSPDRPLAAGTLTGDIRAELAVVGAGFTGLWTALLAKDRDPGRDVVLLDGGTVGWGASGRNGGFCSASLTHGLANGHDRFPAELGTLLQLGAENLDEIEATVARLGIDCDFRRSGELDVATEDYQVEGLTEVASLGVEYGLDLEVLDAGQTRARVDSPLYRGAVWDSRGTAMLDPARLAWGLRDACLRAGVRLYERTPVTGLDSRRAGAVQLRTRDGRVAARRVALATNAFPPLVRRLRHYVVPVYDYVLVTEPLTSAQWAEVGWAGYEGIGDSGNQFHYYRRTADGRILFGGYDAIYYRGNGFGSQHEHHSQSYALLAEHFTQTFPQLGDVRFSHAWGGAIDTCSRFTAFWGTSAGGRVGWSMGYTGLGVGSSRFGARVLLDLLDGLDSERTRLSMVGSTPLPFPPEPLRGIGIDLTRWSLDRADRFGGRRNLWLRTLDRLGLGFDS